MLSIAQFLSDLTNPALSFLPRALAAAVIAAVVCAVVGVHVVLRSMAFIGDAVSHAVFPGIAIAFIVQSSILVGGAIAGAVVAVAVAVLSQRRRLTEDTIIGVLFAAAFALGLLIISRSPAYSGSLESVLFGSVTGISSADLRIAVITGVAVIGLTLALTRPLTLIALDRESARALNVPVLALDIVFALLVTAAIVISVRAVGNVLVIALLVTPPATARLVCRSLPGLLTSAAAIAATGACLGVYLSWALNWPTSATIVLTLTAGFLLTWMLAPALVLLPRAGRRPSSLPS